MHFCDISVNIQILQLCNVQYNFTCQKLLRKDGRSFNTYKILASVRKVNVKFRTYLYFPCSCSQQESLEKVNCRNGMYCTHLLRRIRENRRVEYILMDVATGIPAYCGLNWHCAVFILLKVLFHLSQNQLTSSR